MRSKQIFLRSFLELNFVRNAKYGLTRYHENHSHIFIQTALFAWDLVDNDVLVPRVGFCVKRGVARGVRCSEFDWVLFRERQSVNNIVTGKLLIIV